MFSNRFKLFKLYGFQVWIDWTWLFLAVFISWSLREGVFPGEVKSQSPAVYWAMGIASALGLFLSIVVHEFAHSLVARKRGLAMNGITLFIFGGVAEMSEEPQHPATEFWVAIAGPIMSLVVGALCLAAGAVLHRVNERVVAAIFSYLGLINLTLAGFNLIPAFPLDGGRVLRSILWHFQGDLNRATRVSSQIGTGFGTVLIVLGIWQFLLGDFVGGVWTFLIGSFLRNASAASYQQLVIRRALEGEPVRKFMNPKPVVIPSHISLDEFARTYVAHNYHKSYPVGEDDHVIGVITVDHLKEVPQNEWPDRFVAPEVEPASSKNSISANADAVEAIELMQQNRRTLLLVVDDGHFEGIVTLRDLLRLISFKLDLQQTGETPQVIPPPVIRRQ